MSQNNKKGAPMIDLNRNGINDLQEPWAKDLAKAGEALVKEQLENHPHTRVAKAIRWVKGAAMKVGAFFSGLF